MSVTGIIIAIIFLIVPGLLILSNLQANIAQTFVKPPRYRFAVLFCTSVSFFDIFLLAQSTKEGAESIKQFYDWKHDSLSFIIKSILTFVFGQIALLVKLFYDGKIAGQQSFLGLLSGDFEILLVIMIGSFIALACHLIARIRRIPQEYMDAINLYHLLT